jgi:negative regulator of flagellin synthesis FlgM
MKIGQPSDLPAASPPSQAAATSGAAAKGSPAATANEAASRQASNAGVAVKVSAQVRTLEQASRGEAAEVDMDKVNAVRNAIAQGTYVVNPEAIADKLLANAKEMLDRTRS